MDSSSSSPNYPPQYSPTAPPYDDYPGRAQCVDPNNQLTNAELYPKITKEFKEFKDFKFWNTFQNKRTYLAKGNECKAGLISEELLLTEADPAVPITNSTVGNKVVWTQPQPAPDPHQLPGAVTNNYYGPVINKSEHREFINCCEDCCEDMCENCCLDCSRLTDLSSIVIGSLLGKKSDTKSGHKYDLVNQND